MATASPHDLEIRLFGRFEVLRRGKPVPASSWGRRKTRTLLKVLLTRPGSVFTQDQLIEALYGGVNPQAKADNLRGRISQLRHALEPSMKARGQSAYVIRSGQGYHFDTDACWIDTEVFRERLTSAIQAEEAGHWALAVEAYGTAVDLYRGDFLEEDGYEEWSLDVRGQLRGQHLRALARIAHCYAQLQEFDRAGEWCDRALAIDPATEPVIRQRMEYAYHAGEQGRALQIYRKGIAALREHLAVEPSEETTNLYRQIEDGTLPKEGRGLDPLRIAVLPLVHIGPDPDDVYFTDGMTEELISRLSRVRDLRVIAQTSVMPYRGSEKGVAQIGRELRVGTVLEGSVRRANNHLRIAVQLIDVPSEEHLWSKIYTEELTDVFDVQSDIAGRVTDALRLQLLSEHRERLDQRPTVHAEAYDAYLHGRHFLLKHTVDGYGKAIEYFERALAVDPGLAAACAGLADVYLSKTRSSLLSWSEGFRKAQEYAEKALALDPELSEAHEAVGYATWMQGEETEKAEMHLLRAIELNPSNATAHHAYADVLVNWFRGDEALREVTAALELDPLSPACNAAMADVLFWENADADGAIRYYHRALEIDPDHPPAQTGLAIAQQFAGDWIGAEHTFREQIERDPADPRHHREYAHHLMFRGQFDSALAEIDEALRLSSGNPFAQHVRGEILFVARRFSEARTQLEQVVELDPQVLHPHFILALLHTAEGDFDAAIEEIDFLASSNPRSPPYAFIFSEALRTTVLARSGESHEARRRLGELLANFSLSGALNNMAAATYFALGEHDIGFAHLQQSLERPSLNYFRIKVSPEFDDVRDDPRFAAILERMGF
jgi:TolB-like protein/Tfp pilus assembly protein PilF/DNA-binding winged helix-turn-helix (wHTH) protein